MKKNWITLLIISAMCASPGAAHAYIGPGAGIGVIGSFFALLMGIFVAIAVIISWPLRYVMKRRRKAGAARLSPRADTGNASDAESAKKREP
jgi:uncharacterized membrane protein